MIISVVWGGANNLCIWTRSLVTDINSVEAGQPFTVHLATPNLVTAWSYLMSLSLIYVKKPVQMFVMVSNTQPQL